MPQLEICDAGTQYAEQDSKSRISEAEVISDEDDIETVSPEVSPRKDPIYLHSSSTVNLSDESNSSEGEGEETSELPNPQDDTKYIVFKKELFELSK